MNFLSPSSDLIFSLPNIDPVALAIGPLAIRWYSLAYIAGILFTFFWLSKSNQKEKILSKEALDDWLFWAVLSILIGGRIGYVLFYNFSYFVSNPLEILAFWNGGMSFHGGLLGAISGMWLFCKKYKIKFFKLTDILAQAAPIGLFFGRIANFINMELWGRETNSNFGVIFPNAGPFPRHPSQLYEAFLEGIVLFVLIFFISKKIKMAQKEETQKNRQIQEGFISGIFLIGYGLSRIFVENFRQPDEQIGFIFSFITMGQILCLPLIFLGIFCIYQACNKK